MKILRSISFGCIGIALLLSAGCMNIWSAAEIAPDDSPEMIERKQEIAEAIAAQQRIRAELEAYVKRLEGQLEAERFAAQQRAELEREALLQEIFPARYFYFAGLGVSVICGLFGLIWRFALGGDMRHAIGMGLGGVAVGGSLIGIASLHQSHPWVLQAIPLLVAVLVVAGGAYMLYEWLRVERAARNAQTATEAVQIMARGIESAPQEAAKAVKARIKNNPAAAAKIEPLIRPALEAKA